MRLAPALGHLVPVQAPAGFPVRGALQLAAHTPHPLSMVGCPLPGRQGTGSRPEVQAEAWRRATCETGGGGRSSFKPFGSV